MKQKPMTLAGMLALRKELDPDAPDMIVLSASFPHEHLPDTLGLCPDCYELQHEADCVSDEEAEEEY